MKISATDYGDVRKSRTRNCRRTDKLLIAIVIALFAGLLHYPASAEIIELQQGTNSYFGAQDTTIFQDYPGNSAGGFPYIFAGITGNSAARRSLIKFDLAGLIPAGSTITSATLWLFTEFGRPPQVDCTLHRVVRGWNEGSNPMLDPFGPGIGAPAQTNDPTWNTAAYGDAGAAWLNPGGDYAAQVSGTGHISIIGVWFAITGQGIVDDIQSWVDVGGNNGWILRASEDGFKNAKRFYSSEWPKTGEDWDKQPILTIEFTPPSGVSNWTLY